LTPPFLLFSEILHCLFQRVIDGVTRERHIRFHVDLHRFNILTDQRIKTRLIRNQISSKTRNIIFAV